jgi:hypothetical protein
VLVVCVSYGVLRVSRRGVSVLCFLCDVMAGEGASRDVGGGCYLVRAVTQFGSIANRVSLLRGSVAALLEQ